MSITAMQLALDALEKKNGKWGEGHDKLNADAIAALKKALPPKYTSGHCSNNKVPGGCQLHNLQCGYPECDRKPVKQIS
jgi:hypothetical protein